MSQPPSQPPSQPTSQPPTTTTATTTPSTETDAYLLEQGVPSLQTYLDLRRLSGLSPKTEAQARAALPGSWAAWRIVERESGDVVGMTRVIGDGGWYFHIVDVAVLPTHQRKGLAARLMTAALEHIRSIAPPGAYISLMADAPGRALYRKFGFEESAPHSLGMFLLTT